MAPSAEAEADMSRERYGPVAPVDRSVLAVSTFGNAELEQEVLRLFLSQSQMLISRIAEASATVAAADHVHTLKGSARAIGAGRLADVCETVEEELRAGEGPALLTLVSLVEEACDYIRHQLLR
ncbi:MAG: Hpt domain-containing protein [Pannonibacter sp.]